MALPPVARAAPEHGNIAGHAPFEVAAGGERAGSGKAAFGEHRADECGAPWGFVIGHGIDHGHAGVAEIFQHDGIVPRARPFLRSGMATGGVQRGAGGLCLAAHGYGLRGDLPGHHSRLSACRSADHGPLNGGRGSASVAPMPRFASRTASPVMPAIPASSQAGSAALPALDGWIDVCRTGTFTGLEGPVEFGAGDFDTLTQ